MNNWQKVILWSVFIIFGIPVIGFFILLCIAMILGVTLISW
jgi:hypothetical protein